MYSRYIEPRLRADLADTRVVLLSGPRQAGKTTLARKVAESGASYFTLDDPTARQAADRDPVGFIRGLDRAVAKDRTAFGAPLETFVLSETLKLSSWTGERFEFSHFRDKEENEVDIVIENHERKIVGIEVKASATGTGADFGGLRKLAAAAGGRFALGIVLYDEKQIVPFGPNLLAAPLSCLWG